MALRSRMLAAVAFGPCKHGEHSYARQLWDDIPDDSLTIVDRGFQASNVLHPLFFWSLKHAWTNHRTYGDLEETRQSVFQYIELFYNRYRLHQALGYVFPESFETERAPVMKWRNIRIEESVILGPPQSTGSECATRRHR